MARLILVEATGPIKIDPSEFPRDQAGELKAIFVCACGLSGRMPFCDGTHKACKASEEPGFVYVYDPVTKLVVEKRAQ